MTFRLVNWNVEWASKKMAKGTEIQRRVNEVAPDVVCFTELQADALPISDFDEVILSEADYGYGLKKQRRKVALASKTPWKRKDSYGNHALPPGRIAMGTIKTPVGEVRLVGVCIPWADARVEYASVKRRKWEDHEAYLDALGTILPKPNPVRLIVVGDFNQRVPKGRHVPKSLYEKMRALFRERNMTIVTAGIGLAGKRAIDHVVLSDDLTAERIGVISNQHGRTRLSDHFGIVVDISSKNSGRT